MDGPVLGEVPVPGAREQEGSSDSAPVSRSIKAPTPLGDGRESGDGRSGRPTVHGVRDRGPLGKWNGGRGDQLEEVLLSALEVSKDETFVVQRSTQCRV